MWYVNASTIDPGTTRYFGLLNYFPGQPGWVSQQQLAVGSYADRNDDATQFLELTSNATTSQVPQIRFIAWSEPTAMLFGLANVNNNCVLVSIDPDTAVFSELLVYSNCAAQPMVASSSAPELYAFLKVKVGRLLVRFDVSTPETGVEVVKVFTDDRLVSATARLS
jgi:hypothetical protein